MTKVIFNNEEIELIENLDPGEENFDILNNDDLENTIEITTIKEDNYE